MTWQSDRPYGRLLTKFELRIQALPRDHNDTAAIIEALDELDAIGMLETIAAAIENTIPNVRVDLE